MTLEEFNSSIDKILTETELVIEKESEHIFEFFEGELGELPTFKLMYSEATTERQAIAVVSFHIDLEAPMAIQWYMRIRKLVDRLHITSSYIRDQETGDTYLGQDASIYLRKLIEAEAVEKIKQGVANLKPTTKKTKDSVQTVNLLATDDAASAIQAFDDWKPGKGRPN